MRRQFFTGMGLVTMMLGSVAVITHMPLGQFLVLMLVATVGMALSAWFWMGTG